MRPNPHLYELHTRHWLRRLSRAEERSVTLGTVPEQELARLAEHFDALWLMGLWRRSIGARRRALSAPDLRAGYDAVLGEWSDDDVDGSPYAVAAYEVDPAFGTDDELAHLRGRLNAHGLRLVVDFVPNHLALDHSWTRQRPDWFVQGDDSLLAARPDAFFRTPDGEVLAHGRDPHFPPWDDTAQVDVFHPELRAALVDELARIGDRADGVRCDMAMLVLNGVFERTWRPIVGERLSDAPHDELWRQATTRVRRNRPDFLFIAEAFWDLQPRLLELGFDYAYDKDTYDRLRWGDAAELRTHLAHLPLAERGVRFVENHDEERAVDAFGSRRARAAAAVVLTLPGMHLVHDGQLEGRRIQVPIQLTRTPEEPIDEAVHAFYARLLQVCDDPVFHGGGWEVCNVRDAEHLLAWMWRNDDDERVVIVNYGDVGAAGTVELPPAAHWVDRLAPDFDPVEETRELRVELPPWAVRVFAPR